MGSLNFPIMRGATRPMMRGIMDNPYGQSDLALQYLFASSSSLASIGVSGPSLTFTRASNATFWNSSQQLQYAPHQLLENANLNTGSPPSGWAVTGTGTVDDLTDQGGFRRCTFSHSTFQATYLNNNVTVEAGTTYTAFVYVTSLTQASAVNFLAVADTSGSDGACSGSVFTGEGWYATGFTMGAADTLAQIRVGSAAGVSSATIIFERPGIVKGLLPGVSVGSGIKLSGEPLGEWIGTDVGDEPKYDQPRFDHDPSDGTALGLLIEESRTNICLQSEDFSTTWSNFNQTITTNDAVAPDGNTTADSLNDDQAVSLGVVQNSITIDSATDYTFSVYVKKTTANSHYIQTRVVLTGGTTKDGRSVINTNTGAVSANSGEASGGDYTTSVEDANDYWRIIMICQNTALNTTGSFRISPAVNTDGTATVDNSTTGENHFWGAQIEAGLFPTSYIPTYTAAATRALDACSTTNVSWFNQDGPNTIAITYHNEGHDAAATALCLHDGTINNFHLFDISADGTFRYFMRDGGITQTSTTAAFVKNYPRSKLAVGFDTNDVDVSFDGAAAVNDATAVLPSGITTLTLGDYVTGSSAFNGHIVDLVIYNTKKAAADVVALADASVTEFLTFDMNFSLGSLTPNTGPALTFTRASNALYWTSGQTLQYAQHNFMEETDDLTAASTIETGGSFADNGDGSFRYTAAGINNERWRQNPTIAVEAGKPFFFTCKCKTVSGNDHVAIEIDDTGASGNSVRQWYNLSTGAVGANIDTGTGNTISATISGPDADGFYTVGLVGELTSATTNYQPQMWITSVNGGFTSASGDTDFKEPQFGFGQTLLDYLENTGTSALYDQPRFDHDPSDGTALGLLIEEARTNLILESTDVQDSATNWSYNSSGLTAVTGTGPDGVSTSASVMTDDSASVIEQMIQTRNTSLNSNTNNVCLTVFVKKDASGPIAGVRLNLSGGTGSDARLKINTQDGTVSNYGTNSGTLSSEDLGDWYRVQIVLAKTTGDVNFFVQLFPAVASNMTAGTSDVAATGTATFYGPQMEDDADFPTSYIPTYAASATRAVEVCRTNDMTFWGNRDDPKTIAVGVKYPVGITTSTYILNERDAVGNSADEWRILYTTANTFVQQFGQTSFSENIALDATHKIGYAHDNSGADCAFNGTLETTDSSVTLPSEASGRLSVGTSYSGTFAATCWIQFIRVYNVRKPAAFLASETV